MSNEAIAHLVLGMKAPVGLDKSDQVVWMLEQAARIGKESVLAQMYDFSKSRNYGKEEKRLWD